MSLLHTALVPRSLCEALDSQVIAEAFPGLRWEARPDFLITVTIPVTPQHSRMRVVGAAQELARLSTEQLRQLIGLYFAEPADPRSLLAIITDRVGHLGRHWWWAKRDPLDTEGNQAYQQSYQDLQAAIKALQSVLADILSEEETS